MPEPKSKGVKHKENYMFHEFENDGSSVFTFEDEEAVRQMFYYPHLKPGMVVLDVGCGFGSYTLPALARGCKVIAIDVPNDHCIEKIKGNVGLNNFDNSFSLIPMGVYSKTCIINGIPYTKLDKLIKEKVDYIKFDVEGAELEVLKGARRTIIKNKPIMLVENHLFHDARLETKCVKFVNSLNLGYKWQSAPYHTISHTLFYI